MRDCDQASTPTVARTEPVVISSRAEPRSSHRPTGNAANPETITAIVNAPTSVARLQPRSRSIGGSSTAKP